MFHVRDNLFFGRCSDGAVRIVKFDCRRAPHAMWKHEDDGCTRPTEYPDAEGEFTDVRVVLDICLLAEHWASIVASVSAKGEGGGRYYQALDWHNAKPAAESSTGPKQGGEQT